MSELRDVEAIRADLAAIQHANADQYVVISSRLRSDVEPLLSALAAEKARADQAEQRLFSAGQALANMQLAEIRAEAALADRDAKLAAAQKFRDGVQALFDGEVAARTECAGRAARGEDCGCSTKDCYEHGNWHDCTCSPLDAMVPLAMEYDAALSLSVPTSPQTETLQSVLGLSDECCDESEGLRLGYPDSAYFGDCSTPGCVNATPVGGGDSHDQQ